MKKALFLLIICAAFILYFNFDRFIETVNDFKNPTFNISVENPTLGEDGVLTVDVKLKNVTDSTISVGKLEITYITVLNNRSYEETIRNILVKKTIDKKDQLSVFVMLADYYNSEVEPEAPIWLRQKKKNFGLRISVKVK